MFVVAGQRFRADIARIVQLLQVEELPPIVARQKFRADIASIAQSLRVIAQAIKEQNENEQEKQEAKDDKHR